MDYRAQSLGLVGGVTTVLRDLIHERLGLTYSPSQFEQLGDRLAALVVARGFTSFMDYYYCLKYSDDVAEWGRVMDALAVPETYFWREVDQLRAIVEHVLPALVARGGDRPIRIWSIPCASGEEPLTMAMLLEEHGWFERAPIEISGTDASPAAIQKARDGVYGPRSFRNLSEDRRARYFEPVGEKLWRVSPYLQRRVAFDVLNVMDNAAVATRPTTDVVLCRNLFIYFSDQSVRRTVAMFARIMPEPGFLCVGAAESLLRLSTQFELREIGGAFVYVKGERRVESSRCLAAVSGEGA